MPKMNAVTNLASSRDGYCIIDGVFDRDEVLQMRLRLDHAFDHLPDHRGDVTNPAGRSVRMNLFRYPDICRALFSQRLIAALRELARCWPDEHFVITPENSFMRNGFSSTINEWHKDTDAQESAGWNFHWYPGYSVIQCAVYLQDASSDWGGGLSVIPGSHRIPNPYGLLQQPQLRESWYSDKTRIVIPSRAGDLVCFDMKMDHFATGRPPGFLPPFGDKLALFFSVGPRDALTEMYIRFVHSRPDYVHLASYAVPSDMELLARANNFTFQI